MSIQTIINNLPQTIYCERGDSTYFLSEPLNAISNFSFPIVGYLSHRLLVSAGIKSKELLILSWTLGIIGFGSFTYHTVRNPVTLILDSLPLYAFILYSLFLILKVLTSSKSKSLVILAIFIVVEILLSMFVPQSFINGSIRHITALVFICILGWRTVLKFGTEISKPLILVTGSYVLAILSRSIDFVVCPYFPLGTHFLWHLFAAFAGYQAINFLIKIYKHQSI